MNIPGPASFALYPGQMANVIQGHTLRSNQYLIARVYDAESLNKNKPENQKEDYFNGQILIIKGTEISFYIPPTGIEVKAINNDKNKGYVRDAVPLERLEYCILKDEDGNKRYVHGPEVVFPSPTETFIQDGSGGIKRNAIELSDISGVYVKVIADYTDETGEHKTGEELFITGKDQMIYYPRPEHTFISYNGKIMNHAIAIPKGEGRYVMNRLTGEIKTIKGPAMYLPDPRKEVVIRRTLTETQCRLWYPDNKEVLRVNGYCCDEVQNVLDTFSSMGNNIATYCDSTMVKASNMSYNGTPMKVESNKINRSNSYTPPRTISLGDSKYEGAVAIDVWTGYAINLISKDGKREVVKGPQTILLDYDQTLDVLELSTGKPKTTDKLDRTVFLKYENNRVSDIISVETSDFVKVDVKISYLIGFDVNSIDKWFSVNNYVKHLCDWGRSCIKKAVKQHSIVDLYSHYDEILSGAINFDAENEEKDYIFKFYENGMLLNNMEILSISIVDNDIKNLVDKHQSVIVKKELELTTTETSASIERKVIEIEQENARIKAEFEQYKNKIEAETEEAELALQIQKQKQNDEEARRKQEAENEIQDIKQKLFEVLQERKRKEYETDRMHQEELNRLEIEREAAAAQAMKVVMDSIGPDLAIAMQNSTNRETIAKIAESISPYSIANNEGVYEAISRLTHGLAMEDVFSNVIRK